MFLKVFMHQILLKSRPQKYKDEMEIMDANRNKHGQTAKNYQRIVLMKPTLNSMPE